MAGKREMEENETIGGKLNKKLCLMQSFIDDHTCKVRRSARIAEKRRVATKKKQQRAEKPGSKDLNDWIMLEGHLYAILRRAVDVAEDNENKSSILGSVAMISALSLSVLVRAFHKVDNKECELIDVGVDNAVRDIESKSSWGADGSRPCISYGFEFWMDLILDEYENVVQEGLCGCKGDAVHQIIENSKKEVFELAWRFREAQCKSIHT